MYEILRRKENYINQWLVERELHILQFLMPVTSAFQPPPLVFLYLLEKAIYSWNQLKVCDRHKINGLQGETLCISSLFLLCEESV